MFAGVVSAHAIPVLQYQSTLELPRGDVRAALPVSVTTGADGSVCVVDATTHSGHLLDPHNIHLFSTAGIAGLADPMDMVVEASGGLVCTDSRPEGGRTIRRLDFFGQPLPYEPERPSDLWWPEHLLLTRDGNFVTTDPANGLLVKHDAATGALLWKRELHDDRSGELIGLGRPAEAPDGRLLLPIPGNRQVAVLSAQGEFETAFGTPGGAQGRLSFPVGVAFCPDGTIAVLDRMRHIVLLYDEHYQFMAEFGKFGTGPTDLYYPAAIATTADGRVYVAQGLEGRIHMFRFTTTGAALINASRSRSTDAGREERLNRSRREGGI
jgi:DNA-binding beta-propeller fold protein YncE